jgi:hypothetical protein
LKDSFNIFFLKSEILRNYGIVPANDDEFILYVAAMRRHNHEEAEAVRKAYSKNNK